MYDAATGAAIGFIVPGGFRLIGLAGTQAFDRLAMGVPATIIPGFASGFAEDGVIYIVRLPRDLVVKPIPWQMLEQEERTIFNSIPQGSIVKVVPARQVAPLVVDRRGLLAPGR